jgi:hypothetical protein
MQVWEDAGRDAEAEGGKTKAGRRRPEWDIRAPQSERSPHPRAALHAGRAKLVQVQPGRGRRVLRPLFTFRRERRFLALAGDG